MQDQVEVTLGVHQVHQVHQVEVIADHPEVVAAGEVHLKALLNLLANQVHLENQADGEVRHQVLLRINRLLVIHLVHLEMRVKYLQTLFSSSSDNNSWGNSTKSGLDSYKAPSATDTALRNKSIQNGTAYTSRSDAVNNFTSKYANKYPSRYTSEPMFRPSHIPRSTYYNGANYTVIYNSGFGGYGFYGPSGAWIAYDIMRDTIMLNALMNNNGYRYTDNGGYPVVHREFGFLNFLGICMVVLLICGIFWFVITR